MNRCDVILQQSLVLERLSTRVALMLLEVGSQMLPHRLIRSVFTAADGALNSEVFPVLENVQAQFVFRVEVLSVVIADEVLWLMCRAHVLEEMCWGRKIFAANCARMFSFLFRLCAGCWFSCYDSNW